jgi:hypothetical protein
VDVRESYPQVKWFQGKIEIEIDGNIEEVWLEPKEQNVFTFTSEHPPKLVHFDHQDTWVKEMVFEKPLKELLYQFEYGKDILGRQWAAGELVKLAKDEGTPVADKESIYDAYRRVMVSACYWRFKWAVVIPQLRSMLVPSTNPAEPVKLDEVTIAALLYVIQNDVGWVRSSAIHFLGMARDSKFTNIYRNAA